MSAKDAFFNKVQENKELHQSQEEKTKQDIQAYRNAMINLTGQVKAWLNGSGLEVMISEFDFEDEALLMRQDSQIRKLARYRNVGLKIRNNDKIASLIPTSINWALLMISIPSMPQQQERFLLRLNKEDHSWSIRPDITPSLRDPQPENMPLTEEIFFQTISSLA